MKLLKHCETSWNTRHLMRQYRRSMQRRGVSVLNAVLDAWSFRRYLCGVSCDVSVTPQMCNRVIIVEIWVFFPDLPHCGSIKNTHISRISDSITHLTELYQHHNRRYWQKLSVYCQKLCILRKILLHRTPSVCFSWCLRMFYECFMIFY